ncbi:MAG: hypothetical protein J6Z43_04595 [Clostridiales bacterium]|nr:hypothetical protein [Clostridiales bacterium]
MSIFLELAAFFAIAFLVITLIGVGILIIGIVLDIIWGVRKKKQQKVHAVLKVFAVLLTVVGFLVAVGPVSVLGIAQITGKQYQRYRIADLSEDDLVHVDSIYDNFSDGFTLHGKHYIPLIGLHTPTSISYRDEFRTDKVGAVVDDNGVSNYIYRVDNLADMDILNIENSSDILYAEEVQAEQIIEYYWNEAPLYAQTCYENNSHRVTIGEIDSVRVRQIRDMILENGTGTMPENTPIADQKGYIDFRSNDNLSQCSFYYRLGSEGLMIKYDDKYMMLEGEDADYIMELIGAE